MSMNQFIVHVNFVDIEAYEQTYECGNERVRNLLSRALLSGNQYLNPFVQDKDLSC